MRFLRQILFNNVGLKLLALAISFSLWIAYTSEPFAEVGYNVPLAFVNLPQGLAITGDVPPVARVLIRGRVGLVRQVPAADLSFAVDLSRASAGEMQVRLTPDMVRAPYGTEVVRITPAEFHVSLVSSSIPLPKAE